MKKILFLFVLFSLLIIVGCKKKEEPKTETPPELKVEITYYDGNVPVKVMEYINEITLYNYTKEDYEFLGWYLDSNFNEKIDEANLNQYFTEPKLKLYAKMERIMKDFDIVIHGYIDEKVNINPAFTWTNSNLDSSFKVTLSKGDTIIEEIETNNTYYHISNYLDENSNYEIKVFGNDSKYESSIEFKTIDVYSNTIISISLLHPYLDGCVIQRNTDVIITGYGPMNQTLIAEINDEYYYGVSNEVGYFEIAMAPHEASFTNTVLKVTNGLGIATEVKDVLFGDVYLFSGQSNMQWQTKDSDYTETDLQKLSKTTARFFCQDVTTATYKCDYTKNGRWFTPDSTNVMAFSAIATISTALLGSYVKDETPIGIITAYQGDTNIANWMGPEYYNGTCSTKFLHYNAMIYPLRNTKLSGVVWYQGCNNSAAGIEYYDYLLKLFENYRDLFRTDELPFFVIGLACYDGDSGNNFDFSFVRESQAKACATDSNAYFISSCDDGDPTYIHPRAKHYICERVSKSICSVIYERDFLREGPSYKSHTVIGNKVIIELNNSEGLYSNGEIKNLLLAGADGKYYEAEATIVGETIEATCAKVSNPKYIKYGFGKSPFVNIFNKDNFAITPFRTDDYNMNIDLFDYDKIDDYYFHPDGSKMTISINSNNNLVITKASDGKGYGSVRLDKWGAIIYQPEGFRFKIKGNDSKAAITIRMIEGDSYEIWGYKIIDDFVGYKEVEISAGDLQVIYNKQNSKFEPQKIGYMEIMVEYNGTCTFELCEARFVPVERQKPMNFTISSIQETDETVSISLSNALFANSYELTIKNKNSSEPVFIEEREDLVFTIDKSLLSKGIPYYVYATAKNELGETSSQADGYVFYLKDDNKVIVCNFDFPTQDALDSYMQQSMSVHEGLIVELIDNGVKITSTGKGWQQFIFKLDTGLGNGMSKLEFYADFSNYKGTVVMQLADTSWGVYSYTLDLSEKNEGTFTLDFSSFLKDKTPFTTQNLMWVMFNFSDTVGDGYIILDDVGLLK